MTKFELTINDKAIGFHIGLGFLGEFQDKHDLSINDLVAKMDKNPWKMLPLLMYEAALYRNDGKLDFSHKDLIDYIDEDGGFASNSLQEFLKRFMQSLTKDVPNEDVSDDQDVEDAKKK